MCSAAVSVALLAPSTALADIESHVEIYGNPNGWVRYTYEQTVPGPGSTPTTVTIDGTYDTSVGYIEYLSGSSGDAGGTATYQASSTEVNQDMILVVQPETEAVPKDSGISSYYRIYLADTDGNYPESGSYSFSNRRTSDSSGSTSAGAADDDTNEHVAVFMSTGENITTHIIGEHISDATETADAVNTVVNITTSGPLSNLFDERDAAIVASQGSYLWLEDVNLNLAYTAERTDGGTSVGVLSGLYAGGQAVLAIENTWGYVDILVTATPYTSDDSTGETYDGTPRQYAIAAEAGSVIIASGTVTLTVQGSATDGTSNDGSQYQHNMYGIYQFTDSHKAGFDRDTAYIETPGSALTEIYAPTLTITVDAEVHGSNYGIYNVGYATPMEEVKQHTAMGTDATNENNYAGVNSDGTYDYSYGTANGNVKSVYNRDLITSRVILGGYNVTVDEETGGVIDPTASRIGTLNIYVDGSSEAGGIGIADATTGAANSVAAGNVGIFVEDYLSTLTAEYNSISITAFASIFPGADGDGNQADLGGGTAYGIFVGNQGEVSLNANYVYITAFGQAEEGTTTPVTATNAAIYQLSGGDVTINAPNLLITAAAETTGSNFGIYNSGYATVTYTVSDTWENRATSNDDMDQRAYVTSSHEETHSSLTTTTLKGDVDDSGNVTGSLGIAVGGSSAAGELGALAANESTPAGDIGIFAGDSGVVTADDFATIAIVAGTATIDVDDDGNTTQLETSSTGNTYGVFAEEGGTVQLTAAESVGIRATGEAADEDNPSSHAAIYQTSGSTVAIDAAAVAIQADAETSGSNFGIYNTGSGTVQGITEGEATTVTQAQYDLVANETIVDGVTYEDGYYTIETTETSYTYQDTTLDVEPTQSTTTTTLSGDTLQISASGSSAATTIGTAAGNVGIYAGDTGIVDATFTEAAYVTANGSSGGNAYGVFAEEQSQVSFDAPTVQILATGTNADSESEADNAAIYQRTGSTATVTATNATILANATTTGSSYGVYNIGTVETDEDPVTTTTFTGDSDGALQIGAMGSSGVNTVLGTGDAAGNVGIFAKGNGSSVTASDFDSIDIEANGTSGSSAVAVYAGDQSTVSLTATDSAEILAISSSEDTASTNNAGIYQISGSTVGVETTSLTVMADVETTGSNYGVYNIGTVENDEDPVTTTTMTGASGGTLQIGAMGSSGLNNTFGDDSADVVGNVGIYAKGNGSSVTASDFDSIDIETNGTSGSSAVAIYAGDQSTVSLAATGSAEILAISDADGDDVSSNNAAIYQNSGSTTTVSAPSGVSLVTAVLTDGTNFGVYNTGSGTTTTLDAESGTLAIAVAGSGAGEALGDAGDVGIYAGDSGVVSATAGTITIAAGEATIYDDSDNATTTDGTGNAYGVYAEGNSQVSLTSTGAVSITAGYSDDGDSLTSNNAAVYQTTGSTTSISGTSGVTLTAQAETSGSNYGIYNIGSTDDNEQATTTTLTGDSSALAISASGSSGVSVNFGVDDAAGNVGIFADGDASEVTASEFSTAFVEANGSSGSSAVAIYAGEQSTVSLAAASTANITATNESAGGSASNAGIYQLYGSTVNIAAASTTITADAVTTGSNYGIYNVGGMLDGDTGDAIPTTTELDGSDSSGTLAINVSGSSAVGGIDTTNSEATGNVGIFATSSGSTVTAENFKTIEITVGPDGDGLLSSGSAYGIYAANQADVSLAADSSVSITSTGGEAANNAGIYQESDSTTTVDASAVTITANATTTGSNYGVYNDASTTSLSGDTLAVTASSGSAESTGILATNAGSVTASGPASATITADSRGLSAVNGSIDLTSDSTTITSDEGIFAIADSGTSSVTVAESTTGSGTIILLNDSTAVTSVTSGGTSAVTLTAGTISSTSAPNAFVAYSTDGTNTIDVTADTLQVTADYVALAYGSSVINLNADSTTESANGSSTFKGNALAADGSEINIGLGDGSSTWTGFAQDNRGNKSSSASSAGSINVYATEGATWYVQPVTEISATVDTAATYDASKSSAVSISSTADESYLTSWYSYGDDTINSVIDLSTYSMANGYQSVNIGTLSGSNTVFWLYTDVGSLEAEGTDGATDSVVIVSGSGSHGIYIAPTGTGSAEYQVDYLIRHEEDNASSTPISTTGVQPLADSDALSFGLVDISGNSQDKVAMGLYYYVLATRDSTTDSDRLTGGDTGTEWYLVREAAVNQEPDPDPEPTPEPDPEPTPTPDPDPEPTPEPDPEPTPEPGPGPSKDPETNEGRTVAALSGIGNKLNMHYAQLDDLRKRLGEVRYGAQDGLWVRYVYQRGGYDGVSSSTRAKQNLHVLNLGLDHIVSQDEDSMWLLGGSFKLGHDNEKIKSAKGKGNLNSYGVNLYATYANQYGCYSDLVLSFDKYHQKIGSRLEDNSSANGRFNTWGWGASIEVGKMFSSTRNDENWGPWHNHWWVEPQAQLSYYWIKGKNFSMNNGMTVSQHNGDSLVGRLGVVVGKQWNYGGNTKVDKRYVQAYLKGGVKHEFLGNQKTKINSVAFDHKLRGTAGYYGAGVDWNLTKQVRAYAQVERDAGGKYKKDIEASIGLKWQF